MIKKKLDKRHFLSTKKLSHVYSLLNKNLNYFIHISIGITIKKIGKF